MKLYIRNIFLGLFLCLFTKACIPSIQEEKSSLRLPSLVSDQMVLQQNDMVNLWGWASPNETVKIKTSWNNKSYETVTSTAGKWIVNVPTSEAGGPYEIQIVADTSITIKDVMLGEVWIASGQSNMEWPLIKAEDGAEELAHANLDKIRFFTVQKNMKVNVSDRLNGKWTTCSALTAADFSAVAYFFGKKLHKELEIPIGLIHTSWGATPIEAWTSRNSLSKFTSYKKILGSIADNADSIQAAIDSKEKEKQLIATYTNFDNLSNIGKKEGWMLPSFDDSKWKNIECPKEWSQTNLGIFEGVMWLRKQVKVPHEWIGKELVLTLGPIDEMDQTFVNGQEVGRHELLSHWSIDRHYTISPELVKDEHIYISVRVINTYKEGGINGTANQMKLYPKTAPEESISLAGNWKYQQAYAFPKIPTNTTYKTPTFLYNAMIHPLRNMTIKGVIWYQGEANTSNAVAYEQLFSNMIRDWRRTWRQGDFPFYFVQIAPYAYPTPTEGALLREAQRKTLENVSNTGMAVTLDIGNPKDIHPTNKKEVGNRLAYWALAKNYEQRIPYTGPLFTSAKREHQKVRVFFKYASTGLETDGKALTHFEVSEDGKVYKTAMAHIDGQTILLECAQIPNPKYVRYAWQSTAQPNLFNIHGLPASSFCGEIH